MPRTPRYTRAQIEAALAASDGDVTAAARTLSASRHVIYAALHRHGLRAGDYRRERVILRLTPEALAALVPLAISLGPVDTGAAVSIAIMEALAARSPLARAG